MIDGVIGFLSGDTKTIQAELSERMREAAAEERFEEAARYRNRLFSIRHLADRQAADRRDVGSVDVIGLAIGGDQAAVQVFPLRDGKMIDRYGFHLENAAGEDAQSILEAFVLEYYGGARACRPRFSFRRRSETRRLLRSSSASDVARASSSERRCAVRSDGSSSLRQRTRSSRSSPTPRYARPRARSGSRARGAPRGAQPGEPATSHRVLRRLEHPGRVDRRVDDGVRRTDARRTRTTARSRSAGSRARTTSGRCARRCRGGSRARGTRRHWTRASRGCRTSSSWTAGRVSSPRR